MLLLSTPTLMAVMAVDRRALALSEIKQRASAWNAMPSERRMRVLRAALPLEAASFVAHSNELEGVPTLSAADTHEMVQQVAISLERDVQKVLATRNTYDAHRLAHAFRRERGFASQLAPPNVCVVDELLWHLPQVLAVHRALMSGLHERAGRLRVADAKPKDRDELYLSWAAVPSTTWSFLDVTNDRILRHFGGNDGIAAAVNSQIVEEVSVLDVDDAVCADECARLLSTPIECDVRDVDIGALVAVVDHAAWFAGHFLEIHPFADGNGRLTRILVDAFLATVHPVPVPLAPVGMSIRDARSAYLHALRMIPPCGGGGGWADGAADLAVIILESIVASWRRLQRLSDSICCGGKGPFLGVLAVSMRAPKSECRLRYARLGHAERNPPPSAIQLEEESDALLPPAAVVTRPATAMTVYLPTGRAEDGWLHVTWLP